MIHYSALRILELKKFILENVCCHRTAFEVSDVKADGTVFVKLRSTPDTAAGEVARWMGRALDKAQKVYTRPADHQFRIPIGQF